jgi:glycosyltransferase involved in cell wall biosynthesis
VRLLVDAQCVQSTSSLRGIGRYSLCLLRALVEQAGEHRVEVLFNGGDDATRLLRARTAIETFLPPGRIHVFDAPWPWQLGEQHRAASEAAYAAAVESLRPDAVLVGSVFEGDGENVLSLVRDGPPTAAVLYDLIPAADPGTYLLGPGAKHYWRRFAQLQRTDLLLSISDYSAEQARALMGGDCPPLATIWGGPYPSGDFPAFEPQGEEKPDLALPERFVLSVGGDHPRKNLDRLVLAWGRVPAAHRARTSLVVACGLNTGTVRRLRRLARRAGLLPGELVLTGRVSEQRLASLYRTALAFAFPSTEEGLGMPPIEAMAAGCPTVLARSSSLVELVDDPQAFFDGESIEDIAAAVTRLVVDETYRKHLRQVAARSADRLTWARAAQRAWQALEQLPARPAPVPESAEPVRLAGVPHAAALRASLAGAAAVVAPPEVCSALLAAGVVDVPLLVEDKSERRTAHDPLAALAAHVPALALDDARASALVAAVARAPRWALERRRPVWLLLTDRQDLRLKLTDLADERGADLVVAGPDAAALARSVDLVAVEPGALDPAQLTAARCRGTVVVTLDKLEPDWPALLEDWAGVGRTTGWPWRD